MLEFIFLNRFIRYRLNQFWEKASFDETPSRLKNMPLRLINMTLGLIRLALGLTRTPLKQDLSTLRFKNMALKPVEFCIV